MLVSVDIVGADVWCSGNEVDVYRFWGSGLGVVGFLSVVSVWGFTFRLVDSDQSDVSRF